MKNIPDKVSPWDEELTERDKLLLGALDETPVTVPEIARRLEVPNTFQVREALIGQYGKLEGKGLVRRYLPRGESPTMWSLTFKAKSIL